MDSNPTFAISAAGMALERARVEAAALNLANAHTTNAAGQPVFNSSGYGIITTARQARFLQLVARIEF